MTSSRKTTNRLTLLVLACAIAASVSSVIYFYHAGLNNIYGDGLYHLNTARKMVDGNLPNLWERYLQLGTPWLPLPHLMMLPFIWNDFLWRSGLAGSLVSMICFIIAATLLFRLSLLYYRDRLANPHWAALLTAAIFILNPSNLYMQTTPMTELPFMVLLVAAVYLLQLWTLSQRRSWLIGSATLFTLAAITRYEGWTLLPFAGLVVFLSSRHRGKDRIRDVGLWGAVASLGPIYWLAHNLIIYKNPLEFYNGPYSAHAIYPTFSKSYDWWLGVSYHNVKGALLVTAVTAVLCVSLLVFLFGVGGFINELIVRLARRQAERGRFVIDGYLRDLISHHRAWGRRMPAFLLGLPFLFCIFSLYKNEIQIVPLSMFSLLNVRYGLVHLIPAALFAPAVLVAFRPQHRAFAAVCLALLVIAQYGFVLREGVLQLEIIQEPWRNNINSSDWRNKAKLESYLLANPPAAPVLMDTGYLGSSVLKGGLQFHDILYDGDARFRHIEDEVPAEIQTVIMKDGDVLWSKLHGNPNFIKQFEVVFTTSSSPELTVYRRRVASLRANLSEHL